MALLSTPIRAGEQLDILAEVLLGHFVRDCDSSQGHQFYLEESRQGRHGEVLSLPKLITSDPWSRA